MSSNASVLLNRLLALKEPTPFLLVLDSLLQSAHYLLSEFAHHNNSKIIFLSYETTNIPSYASEWLDCSTVSTAEISDFVKKNSPPTTGVSGVNLAKTLVIIDSLNYVTNTEITQFLTSIIQPSVTILGVYHTNVPQEQSKMLNYPSSLTLLSYIASSIFEVEYFPHHKIDLETLENKISRLEIPVNLGLNGSTFKLTLSNRRKSGRTLIYQYEINSTTHTYEIHKSVKDDANPEDEELLKDLTTFNLSTSNKQKLAREQVELPYMQAQESLGSSGGAIVYEFEKDDDYDEEDPYEDPF
ncbi:hypothetical protein G9P44_003813 [Scheffersomyces stipitis]|nr:hypothetical protein G9P44_003813 [Scheffersomyces stipitis]